MLPGVIGSGLRHGEVGCPHYQPPPHGLLCSSTSRGFSVFGSNRGSFQEHSLPWRLQPVPALGQVPSKGGTPPAWRLSHTGSKKAKRCPPPPCFSLRGFAYTLRSTQQSAIRTSSGLFIPGFCAHVGLKA